MIVIILAIVFFFAPMPDIEMEDDYHLDESTPDARTIDLVASAFLDGGARAIPLRRRAGGNLQLLHQLHDVAGAAGARVVARAGASTPDSSAGWIRDAPNGALGFSNKAASNLASLGFLCFLIGRFTGSAILKKFAAHKVLGLVLGAQRLRSAF